MFWAFGFIIAFALLVAIVVPVGMRIPRAHSASVSARYQQSPEAVFEAISNWREYPKWRKELRFVRERAGEAGRVSWSEVGRQGDMPLEVVESDPPRKLVVKIASDKLAFGGSWTYQIEPNGD